MADGGWTVGLVVAAEGETDVAVGGGLLGPVGSGVWSLEGGLFCEAKWWIT